MSKRSAAAVISFFLALAAGFFILSAGKDGFLSSKSRRLVLRIDGPALSYMNERGKEFYVRPGRAG
jgi:hypothetical protein